MDYQEFLKDCLSEATQIANENFGKVTGVTKGEDNNQVLTETDIAIGKLLVEKVRATYPDHNIIDEEAGVVDNKSNFTWVIDPIDGTSNFANGIPMYGIMMGLLEKETPIAGGIALPAFSQIFFSEKGKGTYCNNERIFVTKETNPLSCLVAYGIDGHQENPDFTRREAEILGQIVLAIRNLRTSNSVFDICMVAKGKYGANFNQTSKIWDNVAPHIIIEEAGGVYTDFFGKPMDYSDALNQTETNFTFCAASPELHEQLQKVIYATVGKT
jgi:myo-inositol-1(or 4)-monophosphatase